MAITFVGGGGVVDSGSLAGTTGIALVEHASAAEGDFMLVFMHRNDDVGDFDGEAGWTRLTAIDGVESGGQDRTTGIFWQWRGAGSSDTTFTHSDGGNEEWSGEMFAFRGVDPTTPLDVTPDAAHYSAYLNVASTNVDVPDPITTVTAMAWVVVLMSLTHDDVTTEADPSGYSVARWYSGSSEDHRQFAVWYKQITSAGVESPGAPAYESNTTSAESTYATMALRPAPDGPTISDIETAKTFAMATRP